MRSPRSVILLGIAAPLMLMQLSLSSCLDSGGGGTTPLFNLPPTVVLTTDVQRGVAPLTVFFSSSGSTDDGVIVKRDWDFGDNVGTSQEISPTYTFPQTGTYTVRLTLTDDRDLTASATVEISVTERPVAIIQVDRTSAESAPATFEFDGSASSDPDAKPGEVLLYRWDFGDGSRELLATVAHTFATPGTYRVRLTVTDAVGVTGFREQIIQVGIPVPTITFRAPPAGVRNIVCSRSSPLWIHAVYSVEPGVPFTIRAGLDGDNDLCGGRVFLYDSATRAELQSLTDPSNDLAKQQGPVRTAAFSPTTGDLLLAGGDDGAPRLYDTASGNLLRRYSGGAGITALAFAPDAATFVLARRDASLTLRETNSNTIVRQFVGHAATINGVAFSPGGSQILAGDDSGTAILWNVADGTEVRRFDHAGAAVTSVAFSPVNPQRVLTGAADFTARLWNTVDGSLVQEYAPVFSGASLAAGHSGAINAVAFSPDGTQVATGSADKTTILWNAALGSQNHVLGEHTAAIRSLAFSPNGEQLVTGSDDHTALIWDLATFAKVAKLTPCKSPVTALGFTPDGTTLLTAIAAENDIPLDTSPSSGSDLDPTVPAALSLSQIPASAEGRQFFLWLELSTDRTTPTRTYSHVRVNVVPEFTSTIDESTPVIPYRAVVDSVSGATQEVASVVLPATTTRRVFDLGQLDVGDRLFLSLLLVPGYGQTYTQAGVDPLVSPYSTAQRGFSLLVLDAAEQMYAWYEAQRVLFAPDAKLIIGHNSNSYYVVLDAVGNQPIPNINVRIQRQFADDSAPRRQYVYLNFDGAENLAVAGSSVFPIAPFTIPGRAAAAITTVKTALVARVEDLLDPYNFVVSTDPPANASEPRLTVYFDITGLILLSHIPDRDGDFVITIADLQFWGLPNYIDPRNQTQNGYAVVDVGDILGVPAYNALADAQLGLALGNAAVHQIGLMVGLRETEQPAGLVDDIMTSDRNQVANAGLVFTTADLAPSGQLAPFGSQDAPQFLTELFGAP